MFYKENLFKEETWIGQIPKDWRVGSFEDTETCLQVTDGFHASPEKSTDGIPLIKAENIRKGQVDFRNADKILLSAHEKEKSRCYPRQGDVLLTCVGTLGRTAVVENHEEFNVSRSVALLKPGKAVYNYFLHYVLNSQQLINQMEAFQTSTTRKGLYLESIRKLKIPLPSISEQKKIVEILACADLTLQKTDETIGKIERLKKGLMQQLLTHGIGHTEYKQSKELCAKIPSEWKVERLDRLIEEGIITYHLDGNHGTFYPREEEFVDRGVPYIGANSILDGAIDFSKAKYVTEKRAKQFRKGIAKDGDVLFAHNATVGPVAVLRTNSPYVILSTSLTAYRCNQNVLFNEFVKYYMESPNFQAQFQRIMKQTTRNQVPITTQKNFYFVLPTLIEQKKIAEILSASEAKITIEKNEKIKLERIKQGLMDLLLTGKVRIKVD